MKRLEDLPTLGRPLVQSECCPSANEHPENCDVMLRSNLLRNRALSHFLVTWVLPETYFIPDNSFSLLLYPEKARMISPCRVLKKILFDFVVVVVFSGMDEVGIYRLSGATSEVRRLKDAFDNSEYNASQAKQLQNY